MQILDSETWLRLISSSKEKDCIEVARVLGALRPWWMTEAGRQVAHRSDQHTPRSLESNEFGVLAVLSHPGSWVHAGIVIPCTWQPRDEHQGPSRLPIELERCANEIEGESHAESKRGDAARRFRLILPRRYKGVDLTSLCITPDSAKAVMRATLENAQAGFPCRPEVTASSNWDRRLGMSSVDGVEHKLAAAHRAGITTVMVSPHQKLGPSYERTLQPEVMSFLDPGQQMRDLRYRLGAPPEQGSLLEREAWYQLCPKSDRKRARFYVDWLVQEIADNAIKGHAFPQREVETLVVAATGAAEALVLSHRIHRPRRMIVVLLDDQSEKFANEFRELMEATPRDLHPALSAVKLEDLVGQQPDRQSPGLWVVDLTFGTTKMKIRLSDWARRHDVHRYCIETEHDRPSIARVEPLD